MEIIVGNKTIHYPMKLDMPFLSICVNCQSDCYNAGAEGFAYTLQNRHIFLIPHANIAPQFQT